MRRVLPLLLLLAADTGLANEGGIWEPMGNQEGISFFRKEVPGSPVIAFKGDGIVDAPLIKVAAILLDDDRSPEWVDSLVQAKVVRIISPMEYVDFNLIGMPPLIKNRDFVTNVKLAVDETAHSFSMEYRSVDDPNMPITSKYVRGDMIYSIFVMTSIEHGTKTRIEAELHADPKGWLPKFLVNFFQKDWPYGTFHGVRKQAAKNDIKWPPMFTDVLTRVERITN